MEADRHADNTRKLVPSGAGAGATIVQAPITFHAATTRSTRNPSGILKGVVDRRFVKGEWGSRSSNRSAAGGRTSVVEGKDAVALRTTNLDSSSERAAASRRSALGGFMTNCCVESTMRNTATRRAKRGFDHVSDCVAETSPRSRKAALTGQLAPMVSEPQEVGRVHEELAGPQPYPQENGDNRPRCPRDSRGGGAPSRRIQRRATGEARQLAGRRRARPRRKTMSSQEERVSCTRMRSCSVGGWRAEVSNGLHDPP